MTLGQLILYMMIGTPQERKDLGIKWKSFCEKHLIADDPYDELTQKLKRERENKDESGNTENGRTDRPSDSVDEPPTEKRPGEKGDNDK